MDEDAQAFYEALRFENEEGEEAARNRTELLKKALKSPVTRTAAAEKLLALDTNYWFDLYLNGKDDISGGTSWEGAFAVAKNALDFDKKDAVLKQKSIFEIENYFFEAEIENEGAAQRHKAGAGVYKWLLRKLAGGVFRGLDGESGAEETASPEIRAVYALSRARISASFASYREALVFFKSALFAEDDKDLKMTNDYALSLIFKYEALFSDFARSYQYAAPAELIALFENWISSGAAGENKALLYKLNFFCARAARSLGRQSAALDFFEKALPVSPDAVQKDACLWYILDCTFSKDPQLFGAALKKCAPLWTNKRNFYDILDKFSSFMARTHKWDEIFSVFSEIDAYADRDSRSKWAYITGRALELGYLRTGKIENEKKDAAFYYEKAFSAHDDDYKPFLPAVYYRELAAKKLDLKLWSGGAVKASSFFDFFASFSPVSAQNTQKMDFLLGFFETDCASFAPRYIKAERDSLSTAELRLLAKKLLEAEAYRPLIDLTIYYMGRDDYKFDKIDLNLSFPRAYRALIEQNTDAFEIPRSLFFSLVRQESFFDKNAGSYKGASGLTQLMKETAVEAAKKLASSGGEDYLNEGELDLFNPEINIRLGALYFRELLDKLQNTEMAIFSYNGGINRVKRWRAAQKDLPDDLFLETLDYYETREYGRAVLGGQAVYEYLE